MSETTNTIRIGPCAVHSPGTGGGCVVCGAPRLTFFAVAMPEPPQPTANVRLLFRWGPPIQKGSKDE